MHCARRRTWYIRDTPRDRGNPTKGTRKRMSNSTNKAVRVALTMAFMMGGLVAGTATAQAAPTSPTGPAALLLPAKPSDCHTRIEKVNGGYAYGVCNQGGGEHRVRVRCDVNNWPDYDAYSPWGPNGQWVGQWCGFDAKPKSVAIETR